ncbi:MAG TPA: NAD(P)-dependent oxidoreductase [Caulobacteraceae bacterium]|jgi:3-hydroxyisobutyrate dehydrogenase-like beta-hydroxyacid dehydrogenase|nr:NAD(P)-dependent oxidoreductase [Caulobacteraceae bacterium]
MKVGFVGLGRMGQAMARRVLDAGHDIVLYNRTPEKTAELAAAGAAVVGSVAQAAQHGGVVVTMLANDDALRAVAQGPGGLLAALPAGGVHVVMGTHGVATVQALAKAHAAVGQALVCAPVLGRPEAVTAGKLGVIVAGPAEATARVAPLFEAIGRRTFDAGLEPGAAAAVKVANNLLLGCAIEALGEAFALTRKSGADPQLFYEVVTDGLFASPAYTVYARIIAEQSYDTVGISTLLGLKDANLALAAGEAVGVPLPSGGVWRDRLIGAIAHGDGERDWASVAMEQARASGLA